MNQTETAVPTLHVAPQNRDIIGYQPIYGPPAQTPKPPAHSPLLPQRSFDLCLGAVALSLVVGVGSWQFAGSYYGAQATEAARQKADAALMVARQNGAIAQEHQQTLDSMRQLLGCVPGGSQ